MSPPPAEVQEWLQKAHSDLRSARILLAHDPPVFDTACFHCQQAVEKALKAFLVWKEIPFEKVHSLVYLLDLGVAQEPGFEALRESAESLAPYAVEIRYPGEALKITREEADAALAATGAVWAFVLGLLPNESRPRE